jgi:hypothetical protein
VKKDKFIGAVSLLLGIVTLIATYKIKVSPTVASSGEPGPRLFPYIAGAILVLCGIGLLVQKSAESEPFLTKEQTKRLWTLFALFILYCVGLNFLGFVISTPIMLFITMTLFAGENKLKLWAKLLYSVGITAVIYLLFVVLFKTNIPSGTLIQMLR